MGYQSKTYSLSDEVIEAIEAARAEGVTPNQLLLDLLVKGQPVGRLATEEELGKVERNVTPRPVAKRGIQVEARSAKTCEHGKMSGYHCGMCGGLAKV